MKINLDPIRQIAEDLTMGDTCLITRDPEHTEDDTWSEATGTYAPPGDDEDTIYDGKCSVYKAGGSSSEVIQGGIENYELRYYIAIPMSEEVTVRPWDKVEITAVDPDNGDSELVGKIFTVVDQEFGTLSATRRIVAVLRNPVQ